MFDFNMIFMKIYVFDIKPECLEQTTSFSIIFDLYFFTGIRKKIHFEGKNLDISNEILLVIAILWPMSIILSKAYAHKTYSKHQELSFDRFYKSGPQINIVVNIL